MPIVLRPRIQPYVQPVDAHAGGAEPALAIFDCFGIALSYSLPESVLLLRWGVANETGEVGVILWCYLGRWRDEMSVASEIRKISYVLGESEVLGESVGLRGHFVNVVAFDQDEFVGFSQILFRNCRVLPEVAREFGVGEEGVVVSTERGVLPQPVQERIKGDGYIFFLNVVFMDSRVKNL